MWGGTSACVACDNHDEIIYLSVVLPVRVSLDRPATVPWYLVPGEGHTCTCTLKDPVVWNVFSKPTTISDIYLIKFIASTNLYICIKVNAKIPNGMHVSASTSGFIKL